jgi:mRNA interferase MazF
MPRAYVPDTGEVVWLEFDPQARHEEAGYYAFLLSR